MNVIYCPSNHWDCPYYDANGCCMMYPDTDPRTECEDFSYTEEDGIDLEFEDDCDDDMGYDPYLGCYTDDC